MGSRRCHGSIAPRRSNGGTPVECLKVNVQLIKQILAMKSTFWKYTLFACTLACFLAATELNAAPKTIYRVECKGDLGECIVLASNENGRVVIPGKARIISVTVENIVPPPCTEPQVSATSIFIFTDPTNPQAGMGWHNIQACADQTQGTATVYVDEGIPLYTTYSSWDNP